MKTSEKPNAAGITVRFSPSVRDQVAKIARAENRSAASYIEQLVERDMREREEAERVVRVYVSPGLADAPPGSVTVEEDETPERYARRSATLDTLFGVQR